MKIAVLKERRAHEKRVAASPESVKKLVQMGANVIIETGAGEGAKISDQVFKDAGASIAKDASSTTKGADIVLKVQAPMMADEGTDELKLLNQGQSLICILNALTRSDLIQALSKQGVQAFAMELVPRISRAQSMDVLSSQANIAGYKAVLDAQEHYGRAMPMMMTAAGTVPPAKVFVMGVGVAGLQAIATARRLGAVVSATDVRPATEEQVHSLGAEFVAVKDDEFLQAQTDGGYAKEMSDEYKAKQAALVAETIAKQDIVIATALIPGRPAPVLVNEDMVKSMKAGSVIVDLAVEAGGNCPLSEFGKVVEAHGVSIIGHANMPSRVAESTSLLYAKNLLNFLTPMLSAGEGKFTVDREDEIIKGTLVCSGGEVLEGLIAAALPKKVSAKKATAKKAAKKTATKKAASKKASAKKSSAKKSAVKKASAKKASVKKVESKEG
ncbi:Re/Si-specific NAD(P)(+) transhydrogenase subunit alpha [Curvivirga aplysinae]|uniref:Re/Si-specific NAD(P)(+) transhydrogenase subunit alpha n=1 Tax=Curvivirga aplysinae TaxID=2529852 RepID=UPI0012BBA4FD|nr:Re/Si-specific NAD(P)(+) transhydrogenase subunit alpha [Curvivirga aplysinae]MTI10809.1 Re/Si-specific NAD(P)(+) transhydrogenase subunit alpha [Curvivirga aplysinae]